MKHKKNELWKLDVLESKFTQSAPRFSSTKKLLHARNNAQLLKKLPHSPQEAFAMIASLKSDLFVQKWHGSHKKLLREIQRKVKHDMRSWKDQKSLQQFFDNPENSEHLVSSKLAKIVSAAILTSKESKQNPPAYVSNDVQQIISDKTDPRNPSQFFKNHCQNDKTLNGYVSSLWNDKQIKPLVGQIDWSFRKIRGNLTAAEKNAHAALTKKKTKHEDDDDLDDMVGSSSEEEEEEEENENDNENSFGGFEDEELEEKDSDDEDDSSENGGSDDEDFADADSKSVEASSKKEKKKIVLPSLATGYFSGGSDDEEDVDNDKIVKAATTVRKNRRGQRARQKIWEMKYGNKAAHLQKEQQRIASEREQRQKEFEERQRKREEKANMAKEKGEKTNAPSAQKMHPSWEAKKKEEERLNAKFQGKKITFD
ncbi:hypothetical protein CLUG_03051 [Clavispora lusitaniae ATCC 42720]|uniref:Bud22 domain-containing protein n=1 Tax=Clavispora lusitaniae (strain ATCC 42720) TaxID=306902 RepID=C4Y3D8_CLAL4|nr:uncharacterized protein CLUG_03051 [Clavispora lusitaniae ATCC 42720]EEQ38925.1 hypothetical protein CLUG_03051 [Clavispora lusitaniae ATCC 42720]